MAVKVISHKSPDTDATCSAIVYAWYLQEVKKLDAQAYISSKVNREVEYVLKKFNQPLPSLVESLSETDQVVIVDTNNPEELPIGVEKSKIIEIVDHHKLVGGLSTVDPISVRMEPLASTCSVMTKIFKAENVSVPTHIAGLMVASIVSDTLKFTSPTTTDYDEQIAGKLATVAGVSIESLAEEMFAAKSNLEGMSTDEILKSDSKVFPMGTKKVRVSVLETTKPENALAMKDTLVTAMQAMKKAEGSNQMFFFVVDIIKSEATLIVDTLEEKNYAMKAFGVSFDGDVLVLPGVVSRKKQMVPKLEGVIG